MVNHNDLGVPNFDASLIPLISDDICFGWNLLHLSPTIRIPNCSSGPHESDIYSHREFLSIRRWQVRYPTIVYKHIRTSAFDSISMYINDQWYTMIYVFFPCVLGLGTVLFLLHKEEPSPQMICDACRSWFSITIRQSMMAMENPSMFLGDFPVSHGFFFITRGYSGNARFVRISPMGILPWSNPRFFSRDIAASTIQVGKQLVESYTNGETPVRLMCHIKLLNHINIDGLIHHC